MVVSTALSRSVSSNTTRADFPPNSSATCESLGAQASITLLPVIEEPVKEIIDTDGDKVKATPASRSPVIMLKTPGGIPASWASFPMNIHDSPAISDGLRMAQFPAINAGQTLRNATLRG